MPEAVAAAATAPEPQAPVTTTRVEPPAPSVAAVTVAPVAPVAPAASASVDIDAMLRAAGLQMASTNPERLQAVQAEQATIAPAPRVRRERKPVAAPPSEPLQQVETRN
jgi:ribonuclease E